MNKIAHKPPLGVMPKEIYEITRIQDITRALYDYAYDEEIMKHLDPMIKWSKELSDRLNLLKQGSDKY